MRLIDADALMNTLGITDMDCRKCAWRDKEWNLCNRGSDFEDACCAIENAPTIEERKWIPCSERLPQPNEEDADGFIKAYLVQDGRWMDVARWNGDCWIAWGYGTALTNVIAWMPLPEPYAEGRTDE